MKEKEKEMDVEGEKMRLFVGESSKSSEDSTLDLLQMQIKFTLVVIVEVH